MRTKTLIPLVVGLAVGFLAIKLGVDMVRRAQGSQGAARGVVVAASSIEATSQIAEHQLSLKSVPSMLVPAGAFTSVKDVVGRVASTSIPRGVVIDPQMLAPPGTEPGLRSRIPDGYRAVSVKVDEASSVAGFLVPGCRVDVSALVTERAGRAARTASRIILRNVEVGAVGQSLNTVGPDGKKGRLSRSVTLLLKPDDVPKLQLAASRGNVHLAMRNGRDGKLDDASANVERMAGLLKELFRKPEPKPEPPPAAPVAPAAPERLVVEVFRGAAMERLVFNVPGKEVGPAAGLTESFRGAGAGPLFRDEAKGDKDDDGGDTEVSE